MFEPIEEGDSQTFLMYTKEGKDIGELFSPASQGEPANPAGNVKSLNILKRLTTNIVYDPNRMCYIGKGTAEDLQNAAEGKFLSVKNK